MKGRKYFGLVLIVVYAFFFASTNYFSHSHQLENYRLVHSHPFNTPGHSHTANQILLISIVDSSLYQKSSDILVPDRFVPLTCFEIISGPKEEIYSGSFYSYSLRAPPANC